MQITNTLTPNEIEKLKRNDDKIFKKLSIKKKLTKESSSDSIPT